MLKKWIMGLSSVAVISLGSAGAAQAAHEEGTVNCGAFSTGEEVLAFWNEHGYSAENDPEGLDRDSDGLPCESLTAGMESEFVGGTDPEPTDPVGEEDSSVTEEAADTEEPAVEEADTSAAPAEEESSEEGGALPDTATNNPMMMLFGVIAAGAGAALFLRRKSVQS